MAKRSTTPQKLRIALIGCGAIAETGHLPGSLLTKHTEITALIDHDIERAKRLANNYGIPKVFSDAHATPDVADAAVICTPPGPHASLSIPLLKSGISTLIEKPVTSTSRECDDIVAAAKEGNAVFAAAMVRRLSPSDLQIREIIRSETFGKVLSFRMDNGYPFSWPSATNFILSKSESGGGVLMGLGSHMFDSMLWLMGKVDSFECYTDAMGGLETECRVEFQMKSGAKGSIELSRSRQLDNRYFIEFEQASLSAPYLSNQISITPKGSQKKLQGILHECQTGSEDRSSFDELMARQLDDFASAVINGTPPMAPGSEVKDSIALIESCYASQQPYQFTWKHPIQVA